MSKIQENYGLKKGFPQKHLHGFFEDDTHQMIRYY